VASYSRVNDERKENPNTVMCAARRRRRRTLQRKTNTSEEDPGQGEGDLGVR
jgi:hypothetical protein